VKVIEVSDEAYEEIMQRKHRMEREHNKIVSMKEVVDDLLSALREKKGKVR